MCIPFPGHRSSINNFAPFFFRGVDQSETGNLHEKIIKQNQTVVVGYATLDFTSLIV
jgi:hypothetical protein